MGTHVLGLSMSSHDRSACLLRDGTIVAAIAEERLDRRKHSQGFYAGAGRDIVLPPFAAIAYVLRTGGIGLDDVALVVCGRSIGAARHRLLDYLPLPPDRVTEPPLPGHHLAHAYAAFATAPFDDPAILVVDEQGHHRRDGTYEKCSFFLGEGGRVKPLRQFFGTASDLSLGMFYNVFAATCGLGEAGLPAGGKLMGLAAYGQSRPEWPQLVDIEQGSGNTYIPLQRLVTFLDGIGCLKASSDGAMHSCDGVQALLSLLKPLDWSDPLAASLARKAQDELERAVVAIAAALRRESGRDTLAYAGGVALNCLANARLQETGFRDVFVHPAATDDGNAIGLAYWGWIDRLAKPRPVPALMSPFLGRRYETHEIEDAVSQFGLDGVLQRGGSLEDVADDLADGRIVCWFDGRSEWGPRALGARSIVADPTRKGVAERINATIKFREPFRPFALSGTQEALAQLVDLDAVPRGLRPYMLAATAVRDARLDPVRHADGSVRIQVVDPELQPRWFQLIECFAEKRGVGAVLNTSFNTLGEPLVETPHDAVRQFLLSGADRLLMGDYALDRRDLVGEFAARAMALAWAQTAFDPLSIALSLEDAGYWEKALVVLRENGKHLHADGLQGERAVAFLGLNVRIAQTQGQTDEAARNAAAVLRHLRFPADAMSAAHALMQTGTEEDSSTAALLSLLCGEGGFAAFSKTAFRRQDDVAPQ
ncbi:nodulation protein-related protein [Mesorhizobium waimense]|uniref:Nodulation protein-related protein n=1 Tax=Mesorhizobium waimense TaxID=1300307 RepID=A0A3A5KIS2_9HYPH|nr:carbamoyltransferase C-terminal domain-containing protein [Mesorhizobium waimense]RJT32606.1 nodulation protein-related protein [Mesorhizobium waimense]